MHNEINGWHTHTEAQVVHRKLETTWLKQNLKGTYHHAALLHCRKKTPLYGISPDLSLSALVLWTVTAVSLRMHYRIIGSGRVFSGFGIWPKYGAGTGKTINILTGSEIWLFPGKRDSPKIGHGMRDLCLRVCRECKKTFKKKTRKFKISIERINLHLTFISFCRD